MDRVTFDFEKNEVIFETNGQQGTEIVPDLKDRKTAIMTAAGYEMIPSGELKDEINKLFQDLGMNDMKA